MRKVKLFFIAMALFATTLAFGQNITVKGVVSDASNGDAVPFASVQLKGTMTGTSSDAEGNYSITVPVNGTLVFSSIGYVTAEFPVGGKAALNVSLNPDSEMLAETIVVAFGTTTKEAFTGSATVMKADQLEKRQTTNVTNALVGAVPGLQMKGASGAPGAGNGSMTIRGISSLYATTEPLVIVDGAPYTASLANIPQGDIESITVLKDAASAALYGARASAGVILVTTKKGASKDAIVNFDAKVGFNSRAIQDYDVITDPGEYYEAYYAQLYNQYFYGQGMDASAANIKANETLLKDLQYNVYTLPSDQKLIGADGKLNPKATLGAKYVSSDGQTYWLQPDNWRDAAYKKALRQDYNVSINGRGDRTSYYASVGYLNEDGVIEYSGYKRFSARVKADYQAKKWIKIGANINYVNSQTTSNPNLSLESGSTNLMYYTSHIAPIYPIYVRTLDKNGNPVIATDANGNEAYDFSTVSNGYSGLNRPFLSTGNPLGANRYNKHVSKYNQFNGALTADIDITPWLKANISSTLTWTGTNTMHYDNALYGPKESVNGQLTKQSQTNMRTNNVQTLTYYNSFGKHNVNAMIGHEYYDQKGEALAAEGQGLFSNDILELSALDKILETATSSSSEYNMEGYFFSGQYNFDTKYYASLYFRREASSNFSKKNGKWWGNYWSFGGAWIASKESFLAGAKWIDILKIKASIGQTGNDAIGSWAYTDLYSLSKTGAYKMSPSFYRIGNEEISWEKTTTLNIGAEFSFWNGRLAGSIDFYNKYTKDLLFWLSIPESIGTRGYYGNLGDIRNTGIELSLNSTIINTKNVTWSIDANISHNKDVIVKLPESKIAKNGGFKDNGIWYKEGGSTHNIFRVKYAGTNEYGQATYWVDDNLAGATDKPGSEYTSTTTEFNSASYYEMGSSLPWAFGGFGTSFRYKGFDFSVTFDYQLGGTLYDSGYASIMGPCTSAGDAGKNFHKDWAKSWTPDNTGTSLPRWQYGDPYTAASSDRFLTDASYLNFQSFSVGYTLPANLIKGVSKIRIYAVGENLAFWSARKGFDPRYSFDSTASMTVYSPVRTISGGVQITF